MPQQLATSATAQIGFRVKSQFSTSTIERLLRELSESPKDFFIGLAEVAEREIVLDFRENPHQHTPQLSLKYPGDEPMGQLGQRIFKRLTTPSENTTKTFKTVVALNRIASHVNINGGPFVEILNHLPETTPTDSPKPWVEEPAENITPPPNGNDDTRDAQRKEKEKEKEKERKGEGTIELPLTPLALPVPFEKTMYIRLLSIDFERGQMKVSTAGSKFTVGFTKEAKHSIPWKETETTLTVFTADNGSEQRTIVESETLRIVRDIIEDWEANIAKRAV
jgi:hypothetical protein